MQEYLHSMFKKIIELPSEPYGVVMISSLLLLVALGIALLVFAPKVKWNAKMLATAALCIALSFVLSYIRLWKMPQGGSVTLASMLPVMLFAYMYGFGPGLICGLAYGCLQIIQDPWIVGFVQVMLDYILAFSGLAIVALFRNWKHYLALPTGVVAATLFRIAMHVFSGVLFFADYAAESGQGVWAYSILYNFTSIGLDGLIVAVITLIPAVQRMVGRMAAPAQLKRSAA